MNNGTFDFVTSREFYDLLHKDNEFCEELGRMTLEAGRLEAELRAFIRLNKRQDINQKATFGAILKTLEKYGLLEQMRPVLEMVKDQRNYLIHNVYALLSEEIKETMLDGRSLTASDVSLYTERAWQLRINLSGLTEIIEKKNFCPES